MDGTLLTGEGTISDENKQAVLDAIAAGHVVMICSGRAHEALLPFLEEEGLKHLPVSGSNGSITVVEGQVIHRAKMNTQTAERLFNWLNERKFPFKIYADQGSFGPGDFFDRAETELATIRSADESDYEAMGLMKEYTRKYPPIHVDAFDQLPADIEIFKFFVATFDPEKKVAVESFAREVGGLNITSSFSDNVELSDALGHKGTGLAAVANHFGISISDTVAMGDNFNDLGMLKTAGLSVAMGNAEEDIKKMVDVVTLTNDEHGVAHAIRAYVLKDN